MNQLPDRRELVRDDLDLFYYVFKYSIFLSNIVVFRRFNNTSYILGDVSELSAPVVFCIVIFILLLHPE